MLRQIEKNSVFDGVIGYGDSYLDFVFCYSKVFAPHAVLVDIAAAILLAIVTKFSASCIFIDNGFNRQQ